MIRILVIVMTFGLAGCATIFSGSSQKVTITANSPDATIIVLGGPIGAAVAKVGKLAALQARLLELLPASLTPAQRQLFGSTPIEYLITSLVMEVKTGQPPQGITAELAQLYAEIPRPVKERLVREFGLETFGVGRVEAVLERGEIYAVIGWKAGFNVQLRAIDGTFNWTTLWNVLNLGIGVVVDVYTGAWLKLSPSKVELSLVPTPAAAP
jgi:hypothetical protein